MFSKKEKKDKKDKKPKKSKDADSPKINQRMRQLIVMDGDEGHDWVKMFAGKNLPNGDGIRVIQASWIEVEAVNYADSGCLLLIAPIRESEGQIVRPAVLTIKPDFVLMRNQPRGPTPESDRRNVLYGLMMANVPSINSCFSEYMNLERPIMFGALQQVKKKLGHDKFPLIDQTYYSSHKQMIIAPEFPVIVKISHAHAGMGKIKLKDNEGFRDLATVMALHKDYCSAEHYYDSQYGIRVQVLGESIRVYKKVFTGSGWKSQFGGSDLQNMEVTDQFREWADECRKLFGGLDIFAIDALHTNEGKDVIIELNGTAIGIHATFYEEDSCIIRDMVVNRMSSIYSPEEIKQPSS